MVEGGREGREEGERKEKGPPRLTIEIEVSISLSLSLSSRFVSKISLEISLFSVRLTTGVALFDRNVATFTHNKFFRQICGQHKSFVKIKIYCRSIKTLLIGPKQSHQFVDDVMQISTILTVNSISLSLSLPLSLSHISLSFSVTHTHALSLSL